MAETVTATKKSSTDKTPAPEMETPAKVYAGGPTMQGISPGEMQQRFGNTGAVQMLAEQAALAEEVEGQAAVGEGLQAEKETLSKALEEGMGSVVDPPPILVDPRQAVDPAAVQVEARATTSKKHQPTDVPVAASQTSAIVPMVESEQGAASDTVDVIGTETKTADESGGVDKVSFKAELTEALKALAPDLSDTSQEEAERVLNAGTEGVAEQVSGTVDTKTTEANEDIATAADPENAVKADPEAATEGPVLVEEPLGEPAGSVSEESVVPGAYPDSQLDYSNNAAPTEQMMEATGVTHEQLAASNEPELIAAADSQTAATEHGQTAPEAYRATEGATRGEGQVEAVGSLDTGIGGFNTTRSGRISDVVGEQGETLSADELKRQEIRSFIVGVKDTTTAEVNTVLETMATEAAEMFETGLGEAEEIYLVTFELAKPGWLAQNFVAIGAAVVSGVKEVGSWFGIGDGGGFEWDDGLTAAFNLAREAYDSRVTTAVDDVATLVEGHLADAATKVEAGRTEIADYVANLDESVRTIGEEAATEVAADFAALETQINEARTGLINSLVAQYEASQQRLAETETRLREENKTIWQKAWDATVGAAQKILEFKDLLLEVLAGAMEVVKAIIADPVGFLKNLIAGIVGGLMLFKDNIAEHLKGGLMGWLFGTLQDAGIELPTSFDLKGILQLVFSVLGATYDFIRGKLVDKLGEETVARLEQAAEIFITLATEGIGGIWEMLLEKIGDIKETVLGAIKGFVIEKIIIAGISWVIGLMNPASAFFKACKAIYDIVMFFIERGQQIMELVNTIIGTISAIVEGKVDAMSTAIEGVLARLLPVVISFLASLLGLGGISDKIREIIEKLRKPVEKAVAWIIEKAIQLTKKIAGVFGGDKNEDVDEHEADELGSDEPHESIVSFEMDGEPHQLTATISSGGETTVTMASKEARKLASLTTDAISEASESEGVGQEDRGRLIADLRTVETTLDVFIDYAEQVERESHRSGADSQIEPIPDLDRKLRTISKALTKLGRDHELTSLEDIVSADRPYADPDNRPKYAAGQVEAVWNTAKDSDGIVRDPNTREVLKWDRTKSREGQWDMGHVPGKEYRYLHAEYMSDRISKEEFLQQYRNPAHYQPEVPSENRSGKHEASK